MRNQMQNQNSQQFVPWWHQVRTWTNVDTITRTSAGARGYADDAFVQTESVIHKLEFCEFTI